MCINHRDYFARDRKTEPNLVSSGDGISSTTPAVAFHRDFCTSSFSLLDCIATDPWPICITTLLSVLCMREWFAEPLCHFLVSEDFEI